METEKLFPIFGQLHQDDSHAVVIPCEKPARKVYENTAKLFVVSADEPESEDDATKLAELIEEAKREQESNLLKVTGDLPVDTIRALYSLAYLSAFFSALEPSDLRRLADELGVRR